MAKKSARPLNSPRPPPGLDGHSLRNEILLGLPSKESALVFSKLLVTETKLNDMLQKSGEAIEVRLLPQHGYGVGAELDERRKEYRSRFSGQGRLRRIAAFRWVQNKPAPRDYARKRYGISIISHRACIGSRQGARIGDVAKRINRRDSQTWRRLTEITKSYWPLMVG
jgi:hypothetical protein